MMNTRILPMLLAGLVLAVAAIAPGIADAEHNRGHERGRDRDDDRGRDRDRGNDERGGGERRLSLDEAMAQAERRYKARAVHGEERRDGDRIVYRIRLLDKDGRVFEVSVDAGGSRDR